MQKIIIVLGLQFICSGLFALEWKNIKTYKKETGLEELQNGCWLKKDRIKNTEVWKNANVFNLQDSLGFQKYQSVSKIRDFYIWFDTLRKEKGNEIEWVGYAAIASKQLSKVDSYFVRSWIVRNKEIVEFINSGSHEVFEFAFPLLKSVYKSPKPITEKKALQWDMEYGRVEQYTIIEPLYEKLTPKAMKKLNKMAAGKGIYALGVPKKIRFEGSIASCENRVAHIQVKIKPYYKRNQE